MDAIRISGKLRAWVDRGLGLPVEAAAERDLPEDGTV